MLFRSAGRHGEFWIAYRCGPIVRSGIDTLRSLQQHINEESLSPSYADIQIHLSVSMGFATHQVDDFTVDGLIACADQRLASDAVSRDPLHASYPSTWDVSPEQIIDPSSAPITTPNAVELLRERRNENSAVRHVLQPVIDLKTNSLEAVYLSCGLHASLAGHDLSDPESFQSFVNRSPRLAVEASVMILHEARKVLDSLRASTEIGRAHV